jgi:hypothetical protein
MLLIAVAVITAASVVLVSGSGGQAQPAHRLHLAATPPAGETAPAFPLLAQNGLSSSSLRPLFALHSGAVVNEASGNGLRCLLITNDGSITGNGDCADATTIESGREIFVLDHCQTNGTGIRRIAGLAPRGVIAVELATVNGTSARFDVKSRAFAFEEKIGHEAVAATRINWLGSGGKTVRSEPLPSGSTSCRLSQPHPLSSSRPG